MDCIAVSLCVGSLSLHNQVRLQKQVPVVSPMLVPQQLSVKDCKVALLRNDMASADSVVSPALVPQQLSVKDCNVALLRNDSTSAAPVVPCLWCGPCSGLPWHKDEKPPPQRAFDAFLQLPIARSC